MSEYLLDTHAFLWFVTADARLPARVRATIDAADGVYVSAATAWEIRTKYRLGKLPGAGFFVRDLPRAVALEEFRELPVSLADGDLAGSFPYPHKDPFDRMIAAQSINHRLVLVSNDEALDAFGVVRVW